MLPAADDVITTWRESWAASWQQAGHGPKKQRGKAAARTSREHVDGVQQPHVLHCRGHQGL
jgi:hypothetical protein